MNVFAPTPVAPLTQGGRRPFWSVMVPTYNRETYLAETLKSVLAQDPGPERMQICVVDNATTTFSVEKMIRDLAGSRVEYIRHESNIGGIANINACIQASRGHHVHVLHDDDMVLSGFYQAMEDAIARHPKATLLVSPVIGIDNAGFVTSLSLPPATKAGVMSDFLVHQATANRALNQGTVVPRRVYEEVGAYAQGLAFTPDWEMAFRAAAHGEAVTLAIPLAAVRWHDGSDSAHLIRGTRHLEEMKLTIDELVQRLSPEQREKALANRYRFVADAAHHYASLLTSPTELQSRLENLRWAYRLDPSRSRLRAVLRTTAKSLLGGYRARLSKVHG